MTNKTSNINYCWIGHRGCGSHNVCDQCVFGNECISANDTDISIFSGAIERHCECFKCVNSFDCLDELDEPMNVEYPT